jgi:hypothetical protein
MLRRAGLAAVALAAVALAGCQHAASDYPSPYGPSRPTALPPVAGGGLWSPAPMRASGYGAATLISRLPGPESVAPPPRSSETPELLTPEQQAARRRDLEAARAGHVGGRRHRRPPGHRSGRARQRRLGRRSPDRFFPPDYRRRIAL